MLALTQMPEAETKLYQVNQLRLEFRQLSLQLDIIRVVECKIKACRFIPWLIAVPCSVFMHWD